jgi:hypothetical protein
MEKEKFQGLLKGYGFKPKTSTIKMIDKEE